MALPSSTHSYVFTLSIMIITAFMISPSNGGKRPPRVSDLVWEDLFSTIFPHKDEATCPANNFYTYGSFIKATRSFPSFGTTGTVLTRKREIAAFLAQISHETTGGWPTAPPDGPSGWGLCYKEEVNASSIYCDATSKKWPCAANKSYHGRGPFKLSWNYNYGQAGKAIGYNLLKNPEKVSNNSVIAFKTALWFWMTAQSPKPSCHRVMTGGFKDDPATNRTAGFGLVTNIITGGAECGVADDDGRVADRIGYYVKYVRFFGVVPGQNLDCANQKPFT